jgi:dTDP-4-dehydrorhamnose reductase
MLGNAVASVLLDDPEIEVALSVRGGEAPELGTSREFRVHDFEAGRDPIAGLLDAAPCDWIVNAIGVIKPLIDEGEPTSVQRAIEVNSLFPYALGAEARLRGTRIIQIATDCVFSGVSAPYDEEAPHDPLDVYGKTKSLGEVPATPFTHLRCSIIGPELGQPRSLLGWLLSQPQDGEVPGFTNHHWNGVTTYHFGRLCRGIIRGGLAPNSPQHVVPADTVSKAELLAIAANGFGRNDLSVAPGPAPQAVGRVLSTQHREENERLWEAADYERPPTIAEMVSELAERLPRRLLA